MVFCMESRSSMASITFSRRLWRVFSSEPDVDAQRSKMRTAARELDRHWALQGPMRFSGEPAPIRELPSRHLREMAAKAGAPLV